MARIVTTALTTFNLGLHLDPQTLELYGIADYFKTPTYTGGSWKVDISSGGLLGMPAASTGAMLHINGTNRSFSLAGLPAGEGGGSYFLLGNSNGGGSTGPAVISSSNRAIFFGVGDSFSSATGGTFTESVRLEAAGNLLVMRAALGYGTGSGGAVTQATSKSTGVTLNKANGQITMNAASLAANTAVSFTLTNSVIAATDVIPPPSIASAATAGAYVVTVDAVAAGSCRISVRNMTGGALAEALVLNFAVIKAVTS